MKLYHWLREKIWPTQRPPLESDDAPFDPYCILTKHAAHLNTLQTPAPDAKVFYELMSGALVWSDETTDDTPTKLFDALRMLWAYRISLILGDPKDSYRPLWEHAESLAPNWIGFRPERRTPTLQLLKVYYRGARRFRACIRLAERGSKEPPSAGSSSTNSG
jgi:hypothetical protein